MNIIAPSLLAASFGRFEKEIESVVAAGADWLHIDVMDGSFVPPITFGSNIVECAKSVAPNTFRDVHLMIREPERHFDDFIRAGADQITFHQEATSHSHRALGYLRSAGVKAGIAINPGTAVEVVRDVIELCDLVLVMTVNPGWGGQKFIQSSVNKISDVKRLIGEANLSVKIQVDGGITPETAPLCSRAGASVFVAGTAIFAANDRRIAIQRIRDSI